MINFKKYIEYYYVEEVEVVVVVVMIDLEGACQVVFVVVDNENVDCNYYDEVDNEKMVDVEKMKDEMMMNYKVAPVDDWMMKMMELLMVLVE